MEIRRPSTTTALPRFLILATLGLNALGLNAAHADDHAAIARIESGLRPSVALADAPLKTARLQDEMARLGVPGVSVAVIRDGKLAWTRGYGVAWTGGPAVTPDTLFQAASISKPVAAMAALSMTAQMTAQMMAPMPAQMTEQNKLTLDATVDTLLTGWKLPQGAGKPTVRQLLSHTGGTSVSGFPGYAAGQPVPTLPQVLDGAAPANTKRVRVEVAPGSAWRYSGGGYTLLQLAMTDVAGQPFATLMHETVLKPLGMRDSTFEQPLPAALGPRAARAHDRDGKPYAGNAHTYPEQAAAGLWTTPRDLATFAMAIQAGAAGRETGVLSPALTRTMLTPVMNDYALGLQIDSRQAATTFGHGGSNAGFRGGMVATIDGGDGAVVLTNGDNGGEIAADLIRAIAAEYKWSAHQTRLRTAVTLAPAAVKSLVGRYQSPATGPFEIAEREGRPMLGMRGQWEPLYAESDQVLFVLSRDADLRPAGAGGGHIVMGKTQVPYTRVP